MTALEVNAHDCTYHNITGDRPNDRWTTLPDHRRRDVRAPSAHYPFPHIVNEYDGESMVYEVRAISG